MVVSRRSQSDLLNHQSGQSDLLNHRGQGDLLNHRKRQRGPPDGEPAGRSAGWSRWDQYRETPYALSASVTGWKNVVPPVLQFPLPPEVRPRALVPS